MSLVFPDPACADPDDVARGLVAAGLAGATAITACCRNGRPAADLKADGSPVTLADMTSDQAVREAVALSFPGTSVVSEETPVTDAPGSTFILVDPLDGTREFVAHGDNWCVCVALVVEGRAVAGAIVAPRLKQAWFGGRKAYRCRLDAHNRLAGKPMPIHVRQRAGAGPIVLASRFHGEPGTDHIVEQLHPSARVPASSAVKFGMIADGSADLYVRCGATMEWDVAAGDAILRAAGGTICDLTGAALHYGAVARQYLNPPFVAAGDAELALAACMAAQRAS